jgi:adenylylsulfate kinase-like enzyme
MMNQEKNVIVWLTGQPGHGKTTLCQELMKIYKDAFHIDGDDIREIYQNKDYSEAGRRKNIELAQHLARYIQSKGKMVLVSLVSPYEDQREEFKSKMGNSILEYYITTDQIRGRENFHVENYQPPKSNYILIDTSNSLEECTNIIANKISEI